MRNCAKLPVFDTVSRLKAFSRARKPCVSGRKTPNLERFDVVACRTIQNGVPRSDWQREGCRTQYDTNASAS